MEVKEEYALNTAALGQGHMRPGGPALFDAALSNALVAIVGHDWPGLEAARGRTLSANRLLDIIESKAPETSAGVRVLLSDPGWPVEVHVNVLRTALNALAPVRHGRGGSGFVSPAAVRALQELDGHPALRSLTAHQADLYETAAIAADADAQARAIDYLELLSDDEIRRRAANVAEALPLDPKERDIAGEPQHCDVCGQQSLIVGPLDEIGMGIGAGTCYVCGYTRSPAAADLAAQHEAWMRFG